MILTPEQVVVVRTDAAYPDAPPFDPSEPFPELDFIPNTGEDNPVYRAVRSAFRQAGLDGESYGSSRWNPLRHFIKPGQTVLLKPNMIKEYHPRDPDGWRYVLTHGSVIRAVSDYVWKALGGSGRLLIADAPQTDSSFSSIAGILGLQKLVEYYELRGLGLELIDLRREEWLNREGVIVSRKPIPGDPAGNVRFDLGEVSALATHSGAGRYYGADYDAGVVNAHHTGGRHEYLISRSAIEADVVFNLPKLKTHKKAGITVALKNLVGINGDKNWLPHHTEGPRAKGGDEHPNPSTLHRLERLGAAQLRSLTLRWPKVGPAILQHVRRSGVRVFGDTEVVVRSGNWWGNDTIWRMCLDLNRILLYGSPDGSLRSPEPKSRKTYLALVDGIIAGEGSGPMNPDPVASGVVIFGLNPSSVDAASATIMGFDPQRIPIVARSFDPHLYPIADGEYSDVSVISDEPGWSGPLTEIPIEATLSFTPHFGWKGKIERLETANAQ